MCGIAGYVGPERLDDARADYCASTMRRRGPDSEGRSRHLTPDGRHVLLLHSRLAILDLDARSDQPFRTDHGELIFNGEIYNYRELAKDLVEQGVALRSTGDTEVLARLFDQYGADALDLCEGMFGLARYEPRSGELVLARDRFGEKPLLVHRAPDGGVYFASEVNALAALIGRPLRPNLRQVRRFLVNGYKSLYKTRETFFEGVEDLPAGHLGIIDGQGCWTDTPWWTPTFGPEQDMSFDEAVSGARERLIRSVELRLRADVPLAFYLSGGVDSNAMIAIAKRELVFDVHGYTIMNSDARYEEADMVAAAVTQLQLQHTPIALQTESFFPLLREQVRYHGAPVYTINSFAGWRLAESIARDGYRVSISGIGADELFSGYYDHHNAYLAHVAATDPQRHQAALEEWNQGIGRFVRNPFLKDAGYLIRRPLARDHIFLDSAEFSQWLARPFRESFSELTVTEPLLRNRMANELLAEAVPVVLHEDDLNAMYHSIENRSPYLDAGLFSWATSIPTTHLVRQGRAKAVLREAVRGIAPDEVLDNPRKVGFNAPIDAFIDRRNPLVMDELLAESPVFDVVARTAMSRLLAEEELANSRNKFLFSFVSTKLFLEEFPP